MGERCFWCNTDPDEAAARHEGPHATWCLHYRRSQSCPPVVLSEAVPQGMVLLAPPRKQGETDSDYARRCVVIHMDKGDTNT